MSDGAKRARGSRWGIRLRFLMGLMVILALGLGWWSNKARRQRWAVEGLERVNGSITYDHVYAGGTYDYSAQPWGPAWLRKRLGDEYFQDVAEVSLLKGREVTDADIAYLEGFPSLKRLYLRGTSITDDGARHLSKLKHLQSLHIGDTKLTDTGLAHLRGLTQLQELIVEQTEITDAGLVALQDMSQLRLLNVRYTRVSGEGLSRLSGLERLQELDVDESQATEALRENLKRFPRPPKIDVVSGSYEPGQH